MTKKILAIVMIAGVLGALVGGCGSKTDDSSPAGTASTTGK